MSRKATTRWHFTFQVLDVGLSIVSGLVLIPLYLNFMPKETYGAWLATGNILMWITAVDPGLTTVLEQRVASAYGEGNHRRIRDLLTAGLLISGVIAALVFGVGLALSLVVSSLIKLGPVSPELITSAFRVAVMGTAITVFSFGLYGMSKGLQGTLASGLVLVGKKFAVIITTISLLYYGYGLMAIPWGKVLGGGLLFLGNAGYLFWRMVNEEEVRFRWVSSRKIGELARLMGYNFFGRASDVISKNVDSFIVGRYVGSEAVAVYRLTKKAPDLVKMFVNRATVAFMPATSHIWGEGNLQRAREVLVRVLCYLIWGLGLSIGGMLAFNDDFVGLWVGADLYAGLLINSLICLLIFVLTVTRSLSNICYSLGNIEGNSIATGVQSFIFIGAALVGAAEFGIKGLIIGAVLSNIIVTIWYYPYKIYDILNLKYRDMNDILKSSLFSLISSFLSVLIFSIFEINSWSLIISYSLAYCLVYLLLLYVMSSKIRQELNYLMLYLKTYFPIRKW